MGQKYSEEFKKEVVKYYATGKSYNQITKEYGVPNATLAGWIKKYSEECKYKTNSKESIINVKEMRDLQKKVAELEKENEFLKKAAAFFAKEID